MLGGGMTPVCSLRTTFSHSSGCASSLDKSTWARLRPPVFRLFVMARRAIAIQELTLARSRRSSRRRRITLLCGDLHLHRK